MSVDAYTKNLIMPKISPAMIQLSKKKTPAVLHHEVPKRINLTNEFIPIQPTGRDHITLDGTC